MGVHTGHMQFRSRKGVQASAIQTLQIQASRTCPSRLQRFRQRLIGSAEGERRRLWGLLRDLVLVALAGGDWAPVERLLEQQAAVGASDARPIQ